MDSRFWPSLLLCAALSGPAIPHASAQSKPQSTTPIPASLPLSPSILPQAEPSKPHRRIYDNDNLLSGRYGALAFADFSEVNDCDRNCFDQIRQLSRVNVATSSNWKRDLLRSLDPVRNDPDWQLYLHQLYDLHLRFCQIGEDKREELSHVADPHNVTSGELAVDDKYDAKFRQAQTSLETLFSRQRGLQQKFAANAYSLQFSQLQVSRIQNAPCAQPRYTAAGPTSADDP